MAYLLILLLSCYSFFAIEHKQGSAQSDGRSENNRESETKTGETAQENGADQAIRINTELLQIDAVVTDKQGRLIDNLKPEDFELVDNGKPQEITFFKIVRGAEAVKNNPSVKPGAIASNIPEANNVETEGRIFLIFVDDLHLLPNNLFSLKPQLLKFIEEKVQENDRVAIVNVSGGSSFIQQLTSDRWVMRRAIERLTPRTSVRAVSDDPSAMTDYQAQLVLFGDQSAIDLAVENYRVNTDDNFSSQETLERLVKQYAREIVARLSQRTTITLTSLRNTINALKSIPGRKALMLVSDGFLTESREANHQDEILRVIDAATRAGVVVYSLNSAGLVVSDPTGRDISQPGLPSVTGLQLGLREINSKNVAMTTISTQTGGFSIINTNDLTAGLGKITNDSELYYLIAYYPQESAQGGKFHKVNLRLKNPKGLEIRARQGFYEIAKTVNPETDQKKSQKKPSEKPQQVEQKVTASIDPTTDQIRNALYSIIPVNGITLKTTGNFIASTTTNENAVVTIAINLTNIQFQNAGERYQNSLQAVLVVFSEDGKLVHSSENKLDLNFTKNNYQRAGKGWFFFSKPLELKPGIYNIRAAVHDPISQRVGSSCEFLEVPDLSKKQLSLSSIILLPQETDDKNNAQKNSNNNVENSPPATSKLDGSVQALRQFTADSKIAFLSYLYNLPKSAKRPIELVNEIKILRGNKEIFTSHERPMSTQVDKSNRIPCGGSIPLTGLPPGRYQLKIEVTEKKSQIKSSQEIDFTIN